MTDKGYIVTVAAADDPGLALKQYGEYAYDHLVLLCPGVQGEKSCRGFGVCVVCAGELL
jgi:hypothetical protein